MVRRAPGACEARVYDVSARANVPLQAQLNVGAKSDEALRRAQRKKEIQNKDSNLLHEFEMPTVSNRIKMSRDGRYIFTSGAYPPQIHVYDTEQLSLKFKRHVDSEIVDFQVLDDDWRKFVLITCDRYLDFHSPFGSHFKVRVPTPPRDLTVHRASSDVFVAGLGSDVWRFNADQGRFLAPLSTKAGLDYSDSLTHHGGINSCGYSPVNHLLGFAGANGLLDIYDPRTIGNAAGHGNKWQSPIGSLHVVDEINRFDNNASVGMSSRHVELTTLRFDGCDGVSFSVGTSDGRVALFDLRASRPVCVRHQGNGLPIRSIRLHDDRTHCISADAKSIKVWRRDYHEQSLSPKNLAVVEPDKDINHLCVIGNSGVLCAAVEAPRMKSFYIPALGTAPRWCSFLDTFTEELEGGRGGATSLLDDDEYVDGGSGSRVTGNGDEDSETVYENYKFVTTDDLQALNLSHLIGSDVLKAYMHGYFIHQRLYKRAMESIQPFAYEKWRKQKARDKINALRQSRITKVRTGPKKTVDKVQVNQNVVDALVAKHESGKKKGKDSRTEKDLSVLQDERFAKMFSDKDFVVDEEAERFQFLNPGVSSTRSRRTVGHREEEGESDEEYLDRFELVDDGEDDEDDAGKSGIAGQDAPQDTGDKTLWSDDDVDDDEDNDDDDDDDVDNEGLTNKKQGRAGVKMYEIGRESDGLGTGLGLESGKSRTQGARASLHVKQTVSLGDRVQRGQRGQGTKNYSRRKEQRRR